MGISTGTCAAAAARAAAMLLLGSDPGQAVKVRLPDGEEILVPLADKQCRNSEAVVMVCKDAGDDPDVTHGLLVGARAVFADKGLKICAGPGVGTVTRPGLAVQPGEPAINPVPRRMIAVNVAEVTDLALKIEIFVPEGEKAAAKTFNERLGIVGGISILGTSGRVRPFSVDALKKTIALNISTVCQSGLKNPVLVPGGIGFRAALALGYAEEEVVEVANEWGFALDECVLKNLSAVTVLGHPGKLLKFLNGDFQTHSRNSSSAVPVLQAEARLCLKKDLGRFNTVEHGIALLDPDQKQRLGNHLAGRVKQAVLKRAALSTCRVLLINLKGEVFGSCR